MKSVEQEPFRSLKWLWGGGVSSPGNENEGGSIRAGRIIGEGMSYYHGISRVIERAFVLSDDEKERFRILLRKTASFSGVTVLTHSILENHDR